MFSASERPSSLKESKKSVQGVEISGFSRFFRLSDSFEVKELFNHHFSLFPNEREVFSAFYRPSTSKESKKSVELVEISDFSHFLLGGRRC